MIHILKAHSLGITFCLVALLLPSCVSVPSLPQRTVTANTLAKTHQWQAKKIETKYFDLISYQPKSPLQPKKVLTVYIEGDGFAWLTKHKISADPTPINHTVLKMALQHQPGNVVYLARPCQYTGGLTARNCNKHVWTDARFSEHVIAANNAALNQLKAIFSAEKLQLIGYSGGGAVASLVAARRSDVVRLITVAGNLDHEAWTKHHKISPLSHSLNPIDYRQQLSAIEQIHFVGMTDKVIPPFLATNFVASFSSATQARVITVPDQAHCCWDAVWHDHLLEMLD